ncbi:MAG: SDR family NAD(P)-dependent oxidoreductase [Bryobacteraceae bacterium]
MTRPLAVITGASSGIGAAFARKLAARGYDLLLVARREDRLVALARQLSDQHGIGAEAFAADLTQQAELESLAERVRSAPNLALLVNNAGFGTNHYFFETDAEGQDAMHRLHVVATARLTHAALANLTPRAVSGSGVINVSSVAAFAAAPQNVSYCATKAWMNRFTEGLAIELGAWNSPVAVQALCPGYTLSEFHDVTGADRSAIPAAFWMTPDSVVEASLAGFAQRKLFVIPGWRYKLLIGALRAIPGPLVRWGSVYFVRRFRKSRKKS